MTFTQQALQKALTFVQTQGRAIDLARLGRLLGTSSPSELEAELSAYQNSDGGFGHSLEPDFRSPNSSVLATTLAFQIIRETALKTASDMIPQAIAYLLRSFDGNLLTWRLVPYSSTELAQAPWWNEYSKQPSLDAFCLNPTAEVLGYLTDYQDLVPTELIAQLTERILHHLGGLNNIIMHDFLCCKRLLDTSSLGPEVRNAIYSELSRLLPTVIATTLSTWNQYNLRPIQVVDRPDSLFITPYADQVEINLDFEVETQQPDGSWEPNWSWNNEHKEEWEKAKVEWKSALVVEKVSTLKRFSRIEVA